MIETVLWYIMYSFSNTRKNDYREILTNFSLMIFLKTDQNKLQKQVSIH